MRDYDIKFDFLLLKRIDDDKMLCTYRTNLHSNYFYLKGRLIDLYDIIRIIEKEEYICYDKYNKNNEDYVD